MENNDSPEVRALKTLAQTLTQQIKKKEKSLIETEIAAANLLSQSYNQRSEFSSLEDETNMFVKVHKGLLVSRICHRPWLDSKPSRSWFSSLIQLTRILLRDRAYQDLFFELQISMDFVYFGQNATETYLRSSTSDSTAVIRGFLSISQKLCNSEKHTEELAEAGLHRVVLLLMASKDMVVLQATLQILAIFCEQSEAAALELCSSNALDQTLTLLKNSDLLTQKLCASLLRILCCEVEAREQIKVYDGLPVLLGLLSTKNVRLQWHVAGTLAQMADDEETAVELGQMGAIPLILSEFRDLCELTSRSVDDWLAMLTGFCALLTQLCHIDANAQLIVQDNGVYILCKSLLLASDHQEWDTNKNFIIFQCSLFCVLRMLFSLERNRHLFKRLFPAEFFAQFIDIGHYVQEFAAYEDLVIKFRYMLRQDEGELQQAIEAINQRRAPLGYIAQYALLEQLGAGAFGCVYKVRKKSATCSASDKTQLYALKEIFMYQSTLEKEVNDDKSVGDVISEIKIIKQQLRHPNIVRYRRIFAENEKLYIVMDLIEGAPLKEHIISIKEKKLKFSEDRMWYLVIQMVVALRYLHKDKRIIHRDLKPNNVMLTDNDHIVITDFGLAKQRGESYLKSTAGTILYSCPEIVQNEQYGDKADVWSLGCVIYEMCMLEPPFYSQNMLQLATAIVESRFQKISTEHYSTDIIQIVNSCLIAKPEQRPDIVGVAQMMANRLMLYIDDAARQQSSAQLQQRMYRSAGSSDTFSTRSSLNTSAQSGGSSEATLPGQPVNLEHEQTPEFSVGNKTETNRKPMKVFNQINARQRTTISSADVTGPSRIPIPSALRQRRSNSASLPSISPSTSMGKPTKKLAWQDSQSNDSFMLPTIRRVNSSSSVETNRRKADGTRVSSATSLVSIPSAKLKPISDPILELLAVLQCIEFVCHQLPTEGSVNHQRRVIEHFEKELFAKDSTPVKIKAELRKLSAQSTDIVALNLGYSDYRPVLRGIEATEPEQNRNKVGNITYEQLYACLQLQMTLHKDSIGDLRYYRPPSRLLTPRLPSP